MLRASPPGALGSRGALGGVRLRAQPPRSAPARAPPPPAAPVAELERLRLHNLSPSPGSRRKNQRIGRGHSAGQGGSCGRGMRGQLANSPGMRTGFEGGQMPLYRRLPKLRGIAGGMPAGLKSHVTINLASIAAALDAGKLASGVELSLAVLKEAGLIKASGRERRLPLKVLGEGALSGAVTIRANAFSAGARDKIAASGGTILDAPGPKKWLRKEYEWNQRQAAAAAAAGGGAGAAGAGGAKAKKA